jgi:hypothetical protein
MNRAHLEYWRQHCCTPEWARKLVAKDPLISVDTVINASAPASDHRTAANNLIVILKSIRKREGSLRPTLARLAEQPETVYSPKRRAGYCRRWLNRINRTL